MNSKRGIGINAILNVIRQGLSVIFPLITYPYVLRTLGAVNIGKVGYAQSIVSYFSLIAILGISSYATREGAKRRDNKVEFTKFTNEIFTINLLSTTLAYALLIISLVFVSKLYDYRLLILLSSSSIILTTLGVDWINTVYEDYLFITVRSMITHIVSLLILFLCIRTSQDYYMYSLLSVITIGIVCVSNWFYCKKYAKIHITLHPNLKIHMKPLLVLFANTLAISIYTNFDTTMLGWLKGDYSVGLYSVSVKIYYMIKSILVALYAVLIPRLAYYFGMKDSHSFKALYTKMWGYLSMLLIPASVGLICVSEEVIIIVGGSEYADATLSLQLLSGALLFAIFGGFVTVCLNITIGREKENLKATLIGAGLNFSLNLIFIPIFDHQGAAFTTLVAEAFVFLFCFIRLPNKEQYLDLKCIMRNMISIGIGTTIIILFTYIIKMVAVSVMLRLSIILIGSSFLYTCTLLCLKNRFAIEIKNQTILKLRGEKH